MREEVGEIRPPPPRGEMRPAAEEGEEGGISGVVGRRLEEEGGGMVGSGVVRRFPAALAEIVGEDEIWSSGSLPSVSVVSDMCPRSLLF